MAQLALLTFREQKSRARLRGLSNWAITSCSTEIHTKLALSELESNTSCKSYTRGSDSLRIEAADARFNESYGESMAHFTPEMDSAIDQLLREQGIDSEIGGHLAAEGAGAKRYGEY